MKFEEINSTPDRPSFPGGSEVQQPTTSEGLLSLSEVELRRVHGIFAAMKTLANQEAEQAKAEVKLSPQSIAEKVAAYAAIIIAIRVAHQEDYANSSADGTVVATDSINDLNTRANQGSKSASV